MTTDPWRSESQVEKSPPDSKNFHVILHLPHFYFSSPFMGYRRECKDTQICREKGEREEINGYSVSGWWITHGLPQKRERENPKDTPIPKMGHINIIVVYADTLHLATKLICYIIRIICRKVYYSWRFNINGLCLSRNIFRLFKKEGSMLFQIQYRIPDATPV